MSDKDKAFDFFMGNKSTIKTVSFFIDSFLEAYDDLTYKKEKEILSDCLIQLFRRYYYSIIIPDTFLTPANIINTLAERQLGKDVMAVPSLEALFGRNLKIRDIYMTVHEAREDDHFFIRDMENLIRHSEEGIAINENGLIRINECKMLCNRFAFFDNHYVNILTLAAIEAGYVVNSEQGLFSTDKGKEFLSSADNEKFKAVISAAAKLCSKVITEAFPCMNKQFSEEGIIRLIKKPKPYELIIKPLLDKYNVNLHEMTEENKNIDELFQEKLFLLNSLLDMYFFTPFSFYLQLIQPLYNNDFDITEEAYYLVDSFDDVKAARMYLFFPPIAYDLTVLGETLLDGTKKPKRIQLLDKSINDDRISDLLDDFLEDFEDWDEYEEDYEEHHFEKIVSLEERRRAKNEDK